MTSTATGADDLGVGIYGGDLVGNLSSVGAAAVLYGFANIGLTGAGNQFFHQNTAGIMGDPKAWENFGVSVASGDFDGDGFHDLAVGVLDGGEGHSGGEVNVLYGTGAGLATARNQLWSQATSGVNGSAESSDPFGGNLVAGDFDGDAVDDLAIGMELEDVGTIDNAGAVNVLYGEFRTGLTTTGNQYWYQGLGIQGSPGTNDSFGSSLAAGDFDRDGFGDLAIGVPFDRVGSVDAGAINVLYGQAGTGLSDEGDQMFNQYFLEGSPESKDGFGAGLAATGPGGPSRSR